MNIRAIDPPKAPKRSPLDAVAQKKWDAYTAARNVMLTRTHSKLAPWACVRADDKPKARRAIIRYLLKALADEKISAKIKVPDRDRLFSFTPAALKDGRLHGSYGKTAAL